MDPDTTDQAVDASGHIFSPKLREERREVAGLYASIPALAARGFDEYDRLYAAGDARWGTGDAVGARECFVTCYVMARELNYYAGEADALSRTALCYHQLGDVARALELLEGSCALCERHADARGAVSALTHACRMLAASGERERAMGAAARAVSLARSASDDDALVGALGQCGSLGLRYGRIAEARAAIAEALGLAVATGDAEAEVQMLQRLAATYARPAPAEAAEAGVGWLIAAQAATATRRTLGEAARTTSAAAAATIAAAEEEAEAAEGGAQQVTARADPAASLRCLQRAASLAEDLHTRCEADGGVEVLGHVLRQLRALYVEMRRPEETAQCEARIDALLGAAGPAGRDAPAP